MCGVVEQGEVGGRCLRLHRRRKIARIPGMYACVLERLTDESNARTKLVRGDELIQLIEAQTCVQGKVVG